LTILDKKIKPKEQRRRRGQSPCTTDVTQLRGFAHYRKNRTRSLAVARIADRTGCQGPSMPF